MAPPKKKPARPIIKAKPEQFIGHESMTMLGTESWEEFEKRIKALEAERLAEKKEGADGMTAALPAHVPSEPEEAATGALPIEPEPPADSAPAESRGLDEDSLPDEYEG